MDSSAFEIRKQESRIVYSPLFGADFGRGDWIYDRRRRAALGVLARVQILRRQLKEKPPRDDAGRFSLFGGRKLQAGSG